MLSKNSSAKDILEFHKSIIWPIIDASLRTPQFPKHFKIPKRFRDEVSYYWDIARDYPLRKGKYVRPTVLALTALSMGAKTSDFVKVAAAMQLSEEWILVQDDWEDESPQRRGKPSLHTLYSEKLVINATAGMQVIMWDLLRENFTKSNTNIAIRIMEEFYLMLSRTVLGQHADIDYVQKNITNYTDDDWYFIADSKTSYYTVAGPLRLGAITANATEAELEILTRFGLNLGRCFQLIDDLLDITSDFGGQKQMGNDIYESKRTLILGHLLQNANVKDKKVLMQILKKSRNQKSEKEVQWVIEKMNQYESIYYAQLLAKKYKKNAEEILDKEMGFISKEPYRTHLRTLMNFILNRDH